MPELLKEISHRAKSLPAEERAQLAEAMLESLHQAPSAEVDAADVENIPRMELQPFEHYDYLCFMFRDIRDWLRVNDTDRVRYEAAKRELATRTWRDMNDYADAKSPVITDITTRAEAWARNNP